MAAEEACRAATPDDLPRLAELAARAVEEQRAQKGGPVWARTLGRVPPFEERLAAEVASPEAEVLVGELDGVALGYAVVRVDVLGDGGRLAVLSDLYVEPGGREIGLGEALMAAVLQWATAAGCFGIDSVALPGDRSTKNFFESSGLVARAILVHRSLT